jgi:hypothetical protein
MARVSQPSACWEVNRGFAAMPPPAGTGSWIPEYIEAQPAHRESVFQTLIGSDDTESLLSQSCEVPPPPLMSLARINVTPPTGPVLQQLEEGFMPGSFLVALDRARIYTIIKLFTDWMSRSSNKKYEVYMDIEDRNKDFFERVMTVYDEQWSSYIIQPGFSSLGQGGRTRKHKPEELCKSRRHLHTKLEGEENHKHRHKHVVKP